MNIIYKKVLKKWKYSETSIVQDANGNKYIEKIESHVESNESEVYNKLLVPLHIEHVPIVDTQDLADKSIFYLEFIEGTTCSDEPKAEYLYEAAKNVGCVYAKSNKCIDILNEEVYNKYYLSKDKMFKHLRVISTHYDIKKLYPIIEQIYVKYKNKPSFVNHFDMHMKNFMVTEKCFYLIDWATTQISPFYTDLYQLLYEEANDVDADLEMILKEYEKSAGIEKITQAEIIESGICWSITVMDWMIDLIDSDDVPFKEWADSQYVELNRLINEYELI